MNTPPNKQSSRLLSYQLNREAKYAIYLTLLYLVGWVGFAYFVPDGTGILGFPLWFELSCLFLPILFMVASMAVLKMVYQDVDLDAPPDDESATQGDTP